MEMLDYAIDMELQGKEYYDKQAEKNKDNRLYKVFCFLSEQEATHAEMIQKRENKVKEIPSGTAGLKVKSLFSDLDDFKSEVAVLAKQLEAYRFALDIEEKSIKLYKEMYEKAEDNEDRELFDFLIKQEQSHYDMFKQLEILVSRPEEWIESAEFGLRDDY